VLATGAARQARWADVLPLAEELLAAAPTSERAFELQVVALVELSRREALERLVAARLAASPGDAAALRARLSRALHDGDVAEALVQERAIVASGKALPSDHNNLAWALLFQPVVEAQALEQARRAVELTRDREAGFLHTLAAVHAARGEAAEALQILRKAVEQAGPENRPAPHDWLVLGLIAERYGLAEEATRIYQRVTPPEQPDGLSSHELAARRLKALAATPAGRP
jgi:tetratricopeptide (TPR) repeat protein